jgi:hypothetical protein
MFYTPNVGFTPDPVSAASVRLTEAEWMALVIGHAAGAPIVTDANGRPVLEES